MGARARGSRYRARRDLHLRHTFATNAIGAGVGLYELARLNVRTGVREAGHTVTKRRESRAGIAVDAERKQANAGVARTEHLGDLETFTTTLWHDTGVSDDSDTRRGAWLAAFATAAFVPCLVWSEFNR